ncbi:MAG TPA: general stress protein CsbD [Bacteroidales bacterium]
MNTAVTGYWNEKKVKLKEKFPHITEEDLNYNEGKEQEMMEILGYKLGLSKQELLNVIVTL